MREELNKFLRAERVIVIRVLRGGNWNDNGENCHSGNRNQNEPDNRNRNIGLRLSAPRSEKIVGTGSLPFSPIKADKRTRTAAGW